jgi:ATP-binding cassette subfamily B protein
MKVTQPIRYLLQRLWRHLSLRRRGQFGLLLLLMLGVSLSEIVSIGAALPFLAVLTNPARVFEYSAIQPLLKWFNITASNQILLPLTVAFALAALVAGAMRLILLWSTSRMSYAAGADLSTDIYRRTLYQPYAVHCARNSGEVISGITSKTNNVIFVINMVLNLISSSVMLVTILCAMLYVDTVVALSAFGGFGLIYLLIVGIGRKRLRTNSECVARESVNVIKSLQEGLGGIRDVLIDGSQEAYCHAFTQADRSFRRAEGSNVFIATSPRYAMEALGMILIAALAYSMALHTEGVATAIPVLGALALGAQRLLPVLQQAYGAWTGIRGGQVSLQDSLDLLDQALPAHASGEKQQTLPFNHSITLSAISFRYSLQTPYVLKELNLTITKGSRIGFIGPTGSGKSSLIDILMGLLPPSEGSLAVDGRPVTGDNYRGWQKQIAHVPQVIFLADSTIAENIAFGVPKEKIDLVRVERAAQQAQIANSIENWPNRYDTFVGERGIRLSGGQRQRIGIARALYKQADVIVFDEATSALDNETEQAVMQAIEGLSHDLTLIIIAHRLTTLKNCTEIVELSDGRINRVGQYSEIVLAA